MYNTMTQNETILLFEEFSKQCPVGGSLYHPPQSASTKMAIASLFIVWAQSHKASFGKGFLE